MGYIITNGKYCINNKSQPTTDFKTAIYFEDINEASKVLVYLPKKLRGYNFRIKPFEKNVNAEEADYKELNFDDAVSIFQQFSNIVNTIKGNKPFLVEQLSIVDKKISDVCHYIESNNFSACDGYKLASLIKTLRQERRKIKNELELYDICKDMSLEEILSGSIYEAVSEITKRTYNPRILKSLFGGKEGEGGSGI